MTETAPNLPANNIFYQECLHHLQTQALILPSIPDIALKIRRAISDPKTNIQQISRIVQVDPSITARLIQIANSPLYQGRRKTESCPEALTRLGLKTAQNIITAIAIRTVFTAKTELIRQKMLSLWAHSSSVAAISAVLAHKTPGFDPDRAMLAGLIHDIGLVPILTFADQHPELLNHPEHLAETVRALRIPLGKAIMHIWDFPDDFAVVIHHAEDWFRDSGASPTYADVVMIAQLHSFIG
ncbi:MAG: HDOD domain-containing protein, partial [Methylomonas sp.]